MAKTHSYRRDRSSSTALHRVRTHRHRTAADYPVQRCLDETHGQHDTETRYTTHGALAVSVDIVDIQVGCSIEYLCWHFINICIHLLHLSHNIFMCFSIYILPRQPASGAYCCSKLNALASIARAAPTYVMCILTTTTVPHTRHTVYYIDCVQHPMFYVEMTTAVADSPRIYLLDKQPTNISARVVVPPRAALDRSPRQPCPRSTCRCTLAV